MTLVSGLILVLFFSHVFSGWTKQDRSHISMSVIENIMWFWSPVWVMFEWHVLKEFNYWKILENTSIFPKFQFSGSLARPNHWRTQLFFRNFNFGVMSKIVLLENSSMLQNSKIDDWMRFPVKRSGSSPRKWLLFRKNSGFRKKSGWVFHDLQ